MAPFAWLILAAYQHTQVRAIAHAPQLIKALSGQTTTCRSIYVPMKRSSISTRQLLRPLSVVVSLAMATILATPVHAEPQQALAILLRQLHAKPLGLYDGVRLLRIDQPGGGSLTLSVSCEREQWRVQNYDKPAGPAVFTDVAFLSAKGIAQTWVCTAPTKVLE